MKLVALSLLLFTGIIGAAYGDVNCVNAKVQLCVVALQTGGAASFDTVCQKVDDLHTCFKNALKDCNEQGMDELNDVTKSLKDICTPGSDLNKKYEQNKDCLKTYAATGAVHCTEALQKVIADIPRNPKADNLKEYAKKVCGALSAIFQCVSDGVEKACNKEAREVVEAVIKPYSKIVTKTCEAVKDKGGDGVKGGDKGGHGGGAGNNALSWTLLAAASLLFALWH